MTLSLAPQQSQGGGYGGLIVLPLVLVAFYFVAIRPSRKRMLAMQAVQQQLEPGRQVVTTTGLYATVESVDEADGTVRLEIAPGVTARFARAAVMKVVDPAPAEPAAADGAD